MSNRVHKVLGWGFDTDINVEVDHITAKELLHFAESIDFTNAEGQKLLDLYSREVNLIPRKFPL